jgi:hypothetical protein
MNMTHRNACFRYILVITTSFSLIGIQPGYADLCCASHSHGGAGSARHNMNQGYLHFQELDRAKCLHSDETASHLDCCSTHSRIPVDFTQVVTLPEKGKAGRNALATAAPIHFTITGSEFPKDRVIPELFTSANSTPIFLRTVVLLL